MRFRVLAIGSYSKKIRDSSQTKNDERSRSGVACADLSARRAQAPAQSASDRAAAERGRVGWICGREVVELRQGLRQKALQRLGQGACGTPQPSVCTQLERAPCFVRGAPAWLNMDLTWA